MQQDPAGAKAFSAMSDAVLAIAAQRSLEPVLRQLVVSARGLVDARYAAIGVPDEDGDGFARFITSGMSDELIDAIGPLPRRHGLLGAMLLDAAPYRTDDITGDPRFCGWPARHPDMRSFMGVPIVAKGEVTGAFYLTDKQTAPRFSADDQQLIELLAAHAAIAIENARLFDLSRELNVLEERNRLARELHDSMNQTLFSLVLTADAAAAALASDPRRAASQIETVKELAKATMAELRSLVEDLRPPALRDDGLVTALRKHADVLRRVHRIRVDVDVEGERRLRLEREREVFRIVQEALSNAVRHADARRLELVLSFRGDALLVSVSDDGVGFDPGERAMRSRRLGLTSMRERARALGGTLRVDSAPGAGTTVRLEVPLG